MNHQSEVISFARDNRLEYLQQEMKTSLKITTTSLQPLEGVKTSELKF